MNLQDVRDKLRSEGIVRDEPGQFYTKWLRGRPYACGPEGVKTSTWFMEVSEEERLAQAEMWLTETGSVAKALYRDISKPDGGKRGIASFDRSYQAACYAVAEVVGPVISSVYTDAVVGFRDEYRLADTLIEMMTKSREEFPLLVVADIYHFFDELDLTHLDRAIDGLEDLEPDLRAWLKLHARTELVDQDGKVVSPSTRRMGVAQGSVLAPLLANLYLLPFDRQLKKCMGPGVYRRYADNLGVLVRTTQNTKGVEKAITEELSRVRLSVKEGSLRVCDVENAMNPCRLLGVAWTKHKAWADVAYLEKKASQLKADIHVARRNVDSVLEYLKGLERYYESVLSEEEAGRAVFAKRCAWRGRTPPALRATVCGRGWRGRVQRRNEPAIRLWCVAAEERP